MKKRLEAWLAKLFCNAVKGVVRDEVLPNLSVELRELVKDYNSLLKLLGKSPYVQLSISHPTYKDDQVVVDLRAGTVTPVGWAGSIRHGSTVLVYTRVALPEGAVVPFNLNLHGDPLTVFKDSVEIVGQTNQLKGFSYL